jgi:hypothetical protein
VEQILGEAVNATVRTAILDVEKVFLIQIAQVATPEPAVDGYDLPSCFFKVWHQSEVERVKYERKAGGWFSQVWY